MASQFKPSCHIHNPNITARVPHLNKSIPVLRTFPSNNPHLRTETLRISSFRSIQSSPLSNNQFLVEVKIKSSAAPVLKPSVAIEIFTHKDTQLLTERTLNNIYFHAESENSLPHMHLHIANRRAFTDRFSRIRGYDLKIAEDKHAHGHKSYGSCPQNDRIEDEKRNDLEGLRDFFDKNPHKKCKGEEPIMREAASFVARELEISAAKDRHAAEEFEKDAASQDACAKQRNGKNLTLRIISNAEDAHKWGNTINTADIEIPKEIKKVKEEIKKTAKILIRLNEKFSLGLDKYFYKLSKIAFPEKKLSPIEKNNQNKESSNPAENFIHKISNASLIFIDFIKEQNKIEAENMRRAVINAIKAKKKEEKELEIYYEKKVVKKKEEFKKALKIFAEKRGDFIASLIRLFLNNFILHSR